jgi:hypothetical protein
LNFHSTVPHILTVDFQPHAFKGQLHGNRKQRCPHNRTREAAAEEVDEANIAVEEVGEEAMQAKDEEVRIREGRGKSRRRRIFWTWGSIWISRLRSNLPVAVKVSFPFVGESICA